MKDALHHIVSSLVDAPEQVSIEESEQEGMTQLTITVAKEDIGKVIGKEGKIIRAIRNAMKIKALKQNKRFNIALAEIS